MLELSNTTANQFNHEYSISVLNTVFTAQICTKGITSRKTSATKIIITIKDITDAISSFCFIWIPKFDSNFVNTIA